MPKNPKRDPLGSINVYFRNQQLQKIQGGTLLYNSKTFGKKSHSAEKNTKGGRLKTDVSG